MELGSEPAAEVDFDFDFDRVVDMMDTKAYLVGTTALSWYVFGPLGAVISALTWWWF